MKFIIKILFDDEDVFKPLAFRITKTIYEKERKYFIQAYDNHSDRYLMFNDKYKTIGYSSWYNAFKSICKFYIELKNNYESISITNVLEYAPYSVKLYSILFSIEFVNITEYRKFINIINSNNIDIDNNINDNEMVFCGRRIINKDNSLVLNVERI